MWPRRRQHDATSARLSSVPASSVPAPSVPALSVDPLDPTAHDPPPADSPSPICRKTLELGPDQVHLVEPRLDARGSPYRPDTSVDGGTAQGLTVRAASVRGRAKRFDGKSREDDFCLLISSARRALIVAVADGLGSAERSGLGAALAVRHAVQAVEEQLGECAPDALDWPAIFNRAAAALVVEHRGTVGHEGSDPPDSEETKRISHDLGTTLTIAVVEPRDGERASAAVAAIGDSPAYRLTGGEYKLLAGERETDDEFSTSSVVALPYLPKPEVSNVQLEVGEVLLVCTDGFSEPLGGGHGEVGRLFARELAVPPPLPSWPYLVDFAKATYDDDRTLVAVWPSDFTTHERDPEAGAHRPVSAQADHSNLQPRAPALTPIVEPAADPAEQSRQ
jgi:serine/threonine protein phosphatase PrpC